MDIIAPVWGAMDGKARDWGMEDIVTALDELMDLLEYGLQGGVGDGLPDGGGDGLPVEVGGDGLPMEVCGDGLPGKGEVLL